MKVRKHRGNWFADFRYTDPKTGKRERFQGNVPRRTKREAERWAHEELRKLETPQRGRAAPTFDEFAPEYLANHARPKLKPSTVETKETHINVHLSPFFGQMRLDMISTRDVDTFSAAKLETHAPKTVHNHLGTLSAMLNKAKRWEYIAAVPSIDMPTVPPPAWTFLDEVEVRKVLKAAASEHYLATMVPFLLGTGARLGEARALRWGSVNLANAPGAVCIEASRSRGKTTAPKSHKRRTVPLNSTARRALVAQKAHTLYATPKK